MHVVEGDRRPLGGWLWIGLFLAALMLVSAVVLGAAGDEQRPGAAHPAGVAADWAP